ncbi:MAG: nucleoside deaminase [Acidobacteriota bacterium]
MSPRGVGETSAPSDEDLAAWSELALEEAIRAAELEEVPVGAVVVLGGEVIGRGHNRTLIDCDPTAHAEVVALREAARSVGNHRLPGSVLVTTLEPCLLCCGAIVQARVAWLHHAADDPKAGALHLLERAEEEGKVNHRVLRGRAPGGERASELLRSFFRARRS